MVKTNSMMYGDLVFSFNDTTVLAQHCHADNASLSSSDDVNRPGLNQWPKISLVGVTDESRWSDRQNPAILIYPKPLTFNHTNGTEMTLPAHSMVLFTSAVGDLPLTGNDVWCSATGETSVRYAALLPFNC